MAFHPRRRIAATRTWLAAVVLTLSCSASETEVDPKPPSARHVVIVSLDTLGARHMGAYGHGANTTPTFDALAREGTLFEHAFTNQTHTLTAHLTLMTGLYPLTHGATPARRAVPAATTLAEILRGEGFATRALTTNVFTSKRFGLGRGFDAFTGSIETGLSANAQLDGPLHREAERARSDPEHRIFLFMHYYDAHSDFGSRTPYDAPRQYLNRYVAKELRGLVRGDTEVLLEIQRRGGPDERELEALHAYYDAGVAYTDQRVLALLVRWLRETRLLKDTLLVITADHGEELFEHDRPLHEQPYAETTRIPLLFVGPGIPANFRVSQPVQLADVMPTVLSLLGLPLPEHVQGHDLTPLLRRETIRHPGVLIDNMTGGRQKGVASWIEESDGVRWSYVRSVEQRDGAFVWTGEPELYDLGTDPKQQNDVAEENAERAAQLELRLDEALRASLEAGIALGVPAGESGNEELLSEEEKEALRGLGYLQ